jgi:SOS response regulatory protein OraA/RecX
VPRGGDERRQALDDTASAEREAALGRAVRALARRDHSTESLRAKLERSGISAQAQEDAVETLARAGYLNDERLARDRAAHLAGRGYGDERIRADLEAQGIAAEAVDEALAALEPERERALREAAGLGGRLRAARTLQRRGFSEDSLEGILGRTVADDP